MTIDGGERVEIEDLHVTDSHEPARFWPGFWVLLAAEAAFVGLAITRRLLMARRIQREVHHG